MNISTAHREHFRSCEILFGSELHVCHEFLDYLEVSGVKSAFRKRAMETRPELHAGKDVRMRKEKTEHHYQGTLPHRQLLFGHFLYYSGLANWRTITRILTWQRTERPRIGELGLRCGIFDQEDIHTIMHYKKPLSPFGQTARMLGLLSDHQLKVLIFQQQRLQKKFGVILLEKNLLKDYELQELLYQFECHNENILTQGRQ